MKTFDTLREGFVSAAQRKAVWASKADGGKGHPDNKKKKSKKEEKSADPTVEEQAVNELDTSTLVSYRDKANKQRYSNNISKRTQRTKGVDRADKKLRKRNIDKFGNHSPKGVDRMGNPKEDSSDAVKAFLAKGGKIKKLPPAKAQGYHGKDDPGKGMHGMMDKPDTKAMGTRKKVKSMEATEVDEISKDTKKSYIKKAVGDIDNRSFTQGLRDKNPTYTSADSKNNRKIRNRRAGINRALEAKETDPPFDNAKPVNKDPKDKFGNPIKNRAKSLARAAARKAVGLKNNYKAK